MQPECGTRILRVTQRARRQCHSHKTCALPIEEFRLQIKTPLFRARLIVTSNRHAIDRRTFLKTAAPFVLGFGAVARAQVPTERGRFNEDQIPLVREQLLKLVNAERSRAGLTSLELDDLACSVATEHARDLIRGKFLSHWGTDGRKPYHRYSFAGGTDAVQENVASAEDIQSLTATSVAADFNDMHSAMLGEVPPNDGHRRTILDPHHTHVGFGIGFQGHSLRLDELYLARYLHIDPVPRRAKSKATIVLTGRLLNPIHFLHEVDVFYEPLPAPPDLGWLRTLRSVALPDVYVLLRPKAPNGLTYIDGTTGDYEWGRDGKFLVPAKLFKAEPGIYTIVFWIRRVPADKAFPGAEVCILSE